VCAVCDEGFGDFSFSCFKVAVTQSLVMVVQMRSAGMDQDDILALLAAFNERGLHFC
jgi:hypothetical protein